MEILTTNNPAMKEEFKPATAQMPNQNIVKIEDPGNVLHAEAPSTTNNMMNKPTATTAKPDEPASTSLFVGKVTPVSTPKQSTMDVDEEVNWVKINTQENVEKEENQKAADTINKRNDAIYGSIADLAADALAQEEKRDAEAAEKLQNAEYVESISEPLNGVNGDKVVYSSIPKATKKKDISETLFDDGSDFDDTELVPSYEEDEEEIPEAEDTEAPDPSDEEKYGEYIRGLESARVNRQEKQVVKEIKSRNVEIVAVPKDKMRTAGDQSFLNAVNKFKKDNFAVVTVPLINSGFNASIVGTGVVDLNNLYLKVDQKTTVLDYQSEQMKVIMKNVVGTNPKINPNNLRNAIHFQDFQMMAFGHICATLNEVETVTNCTECGKPFHITSKPADLLMNMDELAEAAAKIDGAASTDEISLLSKNTVVRTDDNIVIYLGHPSYSESLRMMSAFRNYASEMSSNEQYRFNEALRLLYMIRKIELPGGMTSSNVYQNFVALSLLSSEDMSFLEREIDKMYKQIITPKFGIKEVTCPHCKKVNTNIAYDNLTDLLFYHTTVSKYLEKPEV